MMIRSPEHDVSTALETFWPTSLCDLRQSVPDKSRDEPEETDRPWLKPELTPSTSCVELFDRLTCLERSSFSFFSCSFFSSSCLERPFSASSSCCSCAYPAACCCCLFFLNDGPHHSPALLVSAHLGGVCTARPPRSPLPTFPSLRIPRLSPWTF